MDRGSKRSRVIGPPHGTIWTPTWYDLDPLVLMRVCVERHKAVVMESFESVFKYLECGEYPSGVDKKDERRNFR